MTKPLRVAALLGILLAVCGCARDESAPATDATTPSAEQSEVGESPGVIETKPKVAKPKVAKPMEATPKGEITEEVVPEEETDEIESAFDSNQWNTAVGLGGGKGGRFGGGVLLVESYSGETYSKVAENAFKTVGLEPISTFGVDVDTASYTNVRRFLNYGQLPPAHAVRVEELINYFRYDYPEPKGRDSFSVTMERGVCPWNTKHQLALIGLRGRDLPPDKVPPRNLVFLIDVSGSMSSADKLPLVQRSLLRLVKGLTKNDTVAIVTYAGAESVALEPTNCGEKQKIRDCITGLGAGGSTNGAGGIQKSYELARRNFYKEHVNRVILVTDGDFNVGVSDAAGLRKLVEKERETGVLLTVVGVGSGNLNDETMSTLAKHGNGQYIYLDSEEEARRQFESGLVGTLVTIAKDVKLQVEFNPKRVAGYRLIGYERRVMKKEEFRDDKKDSGEIGAGHMVTALYELVPAPPSTVVDASDSAAADQVLEVRLRYKAPWAEKAKESKYGMAPTTKSTDNLDFAAAVATFGMALAKSAHLGTATLDLAAELASRNPAEDADGKRKEFLRLVETARQARRAIAVTAEQQNERNVDRKAVRHGLEWLVAHQQADGSWKDPDGDPVHDVGSTGLAVLALLGDGNTLRSGPYKQQLRSGVIWLRRQQSSSTGLFSTTASKGAMLDHLIAVLAMSEAHGLSKYKTLKKTVLDGHRYLQDRYAASGIPELGWHIQLATSLAHWGVETDQKDLWAAATKILQRPTEAKARDTDIVESIPRLHRGAVVLLDRFVLRRRGLRSAEPVPPEADQVLALAPTKLDAIDAASFYFGVTAITAVGDDHLRQWRKVLRPAILESQKKDGSFGDKRRVYDTALMTLALQR